MNDLVTLTAGDLRSYAKVALLLTPALAVLSILGRMLAPVLARKLPRAYPYLAALAAIAMAFLHDVLGAMQGGRTAFAQSRVTPADPMRPASVPPRSNGGFASMRAVAFVAVLSLGSVTGLLVACSAAQRGTECSLEPLGKSALQVLVSVIVDAVSHGQPVDPGVADAVDTVEGLVDRVADRACAGQHPAAMARPPMSAALRQAIAAHAPTRSVAQ